MASKSDSTSERWRKVEEIFSATLQCDTSRRSQFLDEACADDSTLRSEVAALLACDGREAEIDSIVASAAKDVAKADLGRQIGPYRLVEEIGHGGMGTVYKALREDDNYRQAVALKLVSRGMDSEFILSRFRHERQILANLNHPNIARILDGGSADDGRPYFVMEYIEGEPIVEYCERRSLPVAARLELFRAVCAAVNHAHQKLVIHRDIKPGNILVTADGVPKLLDFGIAKLLSSGALPSESPRTGTFVRLMTPDYASPEQVRGEELTTATDTYSLGVLLYELLTARHPLELTGGAAAVERIICEKEPPRPSVYRSELRGDLDNIVLLAMRKEPDRRYRSVEQFAEDIDRHRKNLPVLARADTLRYRGGKFVRRNRVAVLAAAAVALSLIGGILASTYEARRARMRFQEVHKLAGSFLFEFHDKIRSLPGATEARAMIVKKAQEYLDNLAKESGADVALQIDLGEAYRKLGSVQGDVRSANLGNTSAAMENYRKAEAILRPLATREPGNLRIQRNLAMTYKHIGDLQAYTSGLPIALETYRRSAAAWEAVLAIGPPGTDDLNQAGVTHADAGRIEVKMMDLTGALESLRRATGLFERGIALDPKSGDLRNSLAAVETVRGTLLKRSGKLPESLASYRKVVAIREALVSEGWNSSELQRDLMIAYGNEAELLRIMPGAGSSDGALSSNRRMLSIAERLAAADPQDNRAKFDYGMSLMRVAGGIPPDQPDQAIQLYQRSLGILEALMHENAGNLRVRMYIVSLYGHIGQRLHAQGNQAAAIESYRKSVALGGKLADTDPANLESALIVQDSRDLLSKALAEMKDRAGALEICSAAIRYAGIAAAAQPRSLDALVTLPRALASRADVLARLGDWAEARDAYREALAAWSALKVQKGVDTAHATAVETVMAGLARCETEIAKASPAKAK